MPERIPINPEEYAHEKGDFTDVHNPEFQNELREAGEKSYEERLEEIKKELFDRDMPVEYQQYIDEADYITSSEPYAGTLMDIIFNAEKCGKEYGEKFKDLIKSEIAGKKVLDLGCGKQVVMRHFFKHSGASMYIGVDLNPQLTNSFDFDHKKGSREDPLERLRRQREQGIKPHVSEEYTNKPKEEMRIVDDHTLEVQSDMLKAVSKMRSASIKLVFMSGIDSSSTSAASDNQKKYRRALLEEISRILEYNGLLVTYDTYGIDLPEMEIVDIGWDEPLQLLIERKKAEQINPDEE